MKQAVTTTAGSEPLISADSHMSEPLTIWDERLPARFTDRWLRRPSAPNNHDRLHPRSGRPGGWDPVASAIDA